MATTIANGARAANRTSSESRAESDRRRGYARLCPCAIQVNPLSRKVCSRHSTPGEIWNVEAAFLRPASLMGDSAPPRLQLQLRRYVKLQAARPIMPCAGQSAGTFWYFLAAYRTRGDFPVHRSSDPFSAPSSVRACPVCAVPTAVSLSVVVDESARFQLSEQHADFIYRLRR